MYAYLYSHLNAELRIPVAVYALALALMGAQAMGRAVALQTPASRWVAVGALLFMASDTILAINKFVQIVPLSPLWILSTYFSAQLLIALHSGLLPATGQNRS